MAFEGAAATPAHPDRASLRLGNPASRLGLAGSRSHWRSNFFWLAPWTCAVWSILAYNLVGSKFWRGREAVEEWRARRGGYVRSVAKGTAWMFACLFFSYLCEFGVLWETRSPGWLPAAAYFPVAFTVAWCSR
jgi:hypothetical protein